MLNLLYEQKKGHTIFILCLTDFYVHKLKHVNLHQPGSLRLVNL